MFENKERTKSTKTRTKYSNKGIFLAKLARKGGCMIYRNTDRAWDYALDRDKYFGGESIERSNSDITAKCELCGSPVYSDEEYYSDGDFDICCSCYRSFEKIW